MEKPTLEEIQTKFGINPDRIGNRPRGWWIVKTIDEEEEYAGAKVGDLCVKTRDGASNPLCIDSIKEGNCIGTQEDGFDCTYRYYYYSELEST